MRKRFIGGLRFFDDETTTPYLLDALPLANLTLPLAELVVDEEKRRVCLRPRWRWERSWLAQQVGFPDWEWDATLDSVTAEEITPRNSQFRGTRALATILGGRGVLLRAPGMPPAIFWCLKAKRRSVLATLPRRPAPETPRADWRPHRSRIL